MQQVKHERTNARWPLLALAIAIASMAVTGPVDAQHRTPVDTTDGGTRPTSGPDYLPGQILMKYRQTAAPPLRLSSAARWQTQLLGRIPQLGVALLQVPVGTERSVAAHLEHDPLVQYVELNYRARALEQPNDPKWPEQWALRKTDAPQAWDIAHCQGTIVAVLDTGVDPEHPDLINTLWTNPGEMPGNGVDDDGNGKVDDVHGWHFYQNCTTATCQPDENHLIQDDNGHGTHVTGIAAAQTGNAIGVAGVSWGARAMILKVLDQNGDGYYYDIAQGIRYAADNGAQVINLSLGGKAFSQLLQDAVDYAHQRGLLLVAAAGNDAASVVRYPAACDNVLAVAATGSDDSWASFSNHGPEVDIAAPGINIISTWPWPGEYAYESGTSIAAAHVSGSAALLWSWQPDLTSVQIQRRLETQADDVNAATYPGADPYLGWGRLNVYRTLAGLAPGPTLTPTPTRFVCRLFPIFKNFVLQR
jgi:subtilisin family serine protease